MAASDAATSKQREYKISDAASRCAEAALCQAASTSNKGMILAVA